MIVRFLGIGHVLGLITFTYGDQGLSGHPFRAMAWGLPLSLALGVFGSGIAYLLNYAVVRAAGASTASTVTYLIPIVSTILGISVLGEPLSWNQPVGAAILLSGIALSQVQHALPRSRRPARQAADFG